MNKKTIIKIVSGIMIFVFIILIAASFYFYNVAVKRADKDFMDDDPNLAVTTDTSLQEEADAWMKTVEFQEVKITSFDALKLKGYYLAADEDKNKTVIIAHGYSGRALSMNAYAKFYHELGYNVLMPDARGHGESEGDYIGFGWHERKDYTQWINYILEKNGSKEQIVLHGVSMGGATVMMTSGEDLPDNVKAIVADCGYTSAKDILTYQLKEMYHLPSFPLIESTSQLTEILAGYSFEEASALEQVKKTDIPILFIHGEDDSFVPVEMVYELYDATNSDKELYIVPDAQHGNAFDANPNLYKKKVSNFIGQYVK